MAVRVKGDFKADTAHGQLWSILGFETIEEERVKALLIRYIRACIGYDLDSDLLLALFRLLPDFEGVNDIGQRYKLYLEKTEPELYGNKNDPNRDKKLFDAADKLRKLTKVSDKGLVLQLARYIISRQNEPDFLDPKEYYDKVTGRAILPKPSYDIKKDDARQSQSEMPAKSSQAVGDAYILADTGTSSIRIDQEVVEAINSAEEALSVDMSGYVVGDNPQKSETAPVPDKKHWPWRLAAAIVLTFVLGFFYHLSGDLSNKLFGTSNPSSSSNYVSDISSDSTVSAEHDVTTVGIETDFDQHLLLKLQLDLDNAMHQYDMGINNWRRLDYPRASRDILAARNTISEQRSQALTDTAIVNNSLGYLYLDMGKYDEAYEYLNLAFTTFENEFGVNGFETRVVRAGISEYYYSIGDYERAIQETQAIIDNSDPTNEQVILASVMHLRAGIYRAVGNYDEAIAMYSDVLALYEDFLSDGNLSEMLAKYTNEPSVDEQRRDYYTTALKWIIRTNCNLGECYLNINDLASAQIALETALKMSLDNVYIGKKNLSTAQIFRNLAVCYAHMGEARKAIDNIEIAIAIERGLFNYEDEYPGLSESYRVYGDILFVQDKKQEALEQYDKALSLAASKLGENHLYVANASAAIGNYYLAENEASSAITYLNRAIDIRKALLATDHVDTVKIYLALASAYELTGDIINAEESNQSATDIKDMLDIGR